MKRLPLAILLFSISFAPIPAFAQDFAPDPAVIEAAIARGIKTDHFPNGEKIPKTDAEWADWTVRHNPALQYVLAHPETFGVSLKDLVPKGESTITDKAVFPSADVAPLVLVVNGKDQVTVVNRGK